MPQYFLVSRYFGDGGVGVTLVTNSHREMTSVTHGVYKSRMVYYTVQNHRTVLVTSQERIPYIVVDLWRNSILDAV